MTDPSGGDGPARSAEPSRPQFGEYASPEEQSRRAGRDIPLPAAPATPAMPAPASVGDPAVRPAHPIDRVAAVGLLAYGLWNVIASVVTFLQPASLMTTMMDMLQISGSFSNYDQAKTWGVVAAILLILGWILTAAWTVLRLRRGRIAWWVPLAGGALFVTLSSLCMLVPFYGDPAVISHLAGLAKK